MQRGLLRRTCYNFMKRSASGSPITLTSSMTTTSPQIILDPAEQQLTNLLREAASTSAFSDSQVVVRYAGGWVRDKILQKKSHDIDIAISSISGHQFAVEFAAFLTSQHPDLKTGTITKILANPEKSKHLDTATSRFLNLDLDFVQLRTESYGSADSRTPSVVDVGTLEEDAERRDCTMNALYYNIHTLQVEDPTRHGLDDLANGLLQTPLPPEKTFLDDPLRVLRCIRFASQFDFSIQADTFAGMATKEVREALKCKVVKERVGIEVYKMMKGINPPKAIRALHSQQLYQIVFQDAGSEEEFPWFDFAVVERAINVLSTSLRLRDHLSEYTADGRLWFIVAILPYCRQLRPVPKKKDVEEPLGCVMVRDYLKLTSLLEALVKATFPPREVSVSIDATPLELGKFVRLLKKDWKLALFVSFVADRAHAVNVDGLVALMDRITECGLDRAWSFTSFIDGKKIKPLLEEHGTHIKVMKELVELVIEYRIEEPDITEEQAMAKLREYLKTRPIGPEGW